MISEKKKIKVAFLTLGCKVNQYETDAMKEQFEHAGAEITDFQDVADVYIVNTCSVTNVADKKSRQMLHRAKKKNPDALVVAAGCYVQAAKEVLEKDAFVDLVVGNNKKKDIVTIVSNYMKDQKEETVIDIGQVHEFEEMGMSHIDGHTRAYIKVQDGCNQFCSYCIIPYARGRVRSRKPEDVVKEISLLVDQGIKEFVLTGIHLSSYGIDTGTDLLFLIRTVHEVAGIKRIRLGSLEPRIITEEFAEAIAGLPKMCPHFHLSLQSGCTETLKRMNRRYTAEEYYEKCELLRKYFRNPALTTDVIVGFPGETEEEFKASRDFIDKVDFYETHVFKYSRREGTKAAAMPDQVPEEEKTRRSNILLDLSRKKQAAYEQRLLGTTQEVLIEEEIRRNGEIYQVGHTREYVKIGIRTEEKLANRLVQIEIENPFQIIH